MMRIKGLIKQGLKIAGQPAEHAISLTRILVRYGEVSGVE
jgi:hypothetical protein